MIGAATAAGRSADTRAIRHSDETAGQSRVRRWAHAGADVAWHALIVVTIASVGMLWAAVLVNRFYGLSGVWWTAQDTLDGLVGGLGATALLGQHILVHYIVIKKLATGRPG